MTEVFFSSEGWNWLGRLLENTDKAVILCDTNTRQCVEYLNSVCSKTRELSIVEIPAGEKNKSLNICEFVWQRLTELGANRHTILLNLGGGVTTDLGGFVASTYMRGMRFVHIPTSLLAMVDAAIGGKTGVNFGKLKNMIGLFSQPQGVLVDSKFLESLPQREYKSGLAEVLKHAFISNPNILNLINGNQNELISSSIQVKLEVVKVDEFEKGERKKLNFGHTIGHAIESHFLDSDNPFLHGEAIAAGMILAAFISKSKVGLGDTDFAVICFQIDSVFSRIKIQNSDCEEVKRLLMYDKKNRAGKVQFVLLKKLGQAVVDQEVTEEELDVAFGFYSSDL